MSLPILDSGVDLSELLGDDLDDLDAFLGIEAFDGIRAGDQAAPADALPLSEPRLSVPAAFSEQLLQQMAFTPVGAPVESPVKLEAASSWDGLSWGQGGGLPPLPPQPAYYSAEAAASYANTTALVAAAQAQMNAAAAGPAAARVELQEAVTAMSAQLRSIPSMVAADIARAAAVAAATGAAGTAATGAVTSAPQPQHVPFQQMQQQLQHPVLGMPQQAAQQPTQPKQQQGPQQAVPAALLAKAAAISGQSNAATAAFTLPKQQQQQPAVAPAAGTGMLSMGSRAPMSASTAGAQFAGLGASAGLQSAGMSLALPDQFKGVMLTPAGATTGVAVGANLVTWVHGLQHIAAQQQEARELKRSNKAAARKKDKVSVLQTELADKQAHLQALSLENMALTAKARALEQLVKSAGDDVSLMEEQLAQLSLRQDSKSESQHAAAEAAAAAVAALQSGIRWPPAQPQQQQAQQHQQQMQQQQQQQPQQMGMQGQLGMGAPGQQQQQQQQVAGANQKPSSYQYQQLHRQGLQMLMSSKLESLEDILGNVIAPAAAAPAAAAGGATSALRSGGAAAAGAAGAPAAGQFGTSSSPFSGLAGFPNAAAAPAAGLFGSNMSGQGSQMPSPPAGAAVSGAAEPAMVFGSAPQQQQQQHMQTQQMQHMQQQQQVQQQQYMLPQLQVSPQLQPLQQQHMQPGALQQQQWGQMNLIAYDLPMQLSPQQQLQQQQQQQQGLCNGYIGAVSPATVTGPDTSTCSSLSGEPSSPSLCGRSSSVTSGGINGNLMGTAAAAAAAAQAAAAGRGGGLLLAGRAEHFQQMHDAASVVYPHGVMRPAKQLQEKLPQIQALHKRVVLQLMPLLLQVQHERLQQQLDMHASAVEGCSTAAQQQQQGRSAAQQAEQDLTNTPAMRKLIEVMLQYSKDIHTFAIANRLSTYELYTLNIETGVLGQPPPDGHWRKVANMLKERLTPQALADLCVARQLYSCTMMRIKQQRQLLVLQLAQLLWRWEGDPQVAYRTDAPFYSVAGLHCEGTLVLDAVETNMRKEYTLEGVYQWMTHHIIPMHVLAELVVHSYPFKADIHMTLQELMRDQPMPALTALQQLQLKQLQEQQEALIAQQQQQQQQQAATLLVQQQQHQAAAAAAMLAQQQQAAQTLQVLQQQRSMLGAAAPGGGAYLFPT